MRLGGINSVEEQTTEPDVRVTWIFRKGDTSEIGFAFNLFTIACGSFIVGMAGLIFWVVTPNPEIH